MVSPRLYITSLYLETGKVGMAKEAPETGSAASKGYEKHLLFPSGWQQRFAHLLGNMLTRRRLGSCSCTSVSCFHFAMFRFSLVMWTTAVSARAQVAHRNHYIVMR